MFELFSFLPKEIVIFLISMVPIGELRVAIPIAINKYGMGALSAYTWAVLGNIFPVIFVVFFLEKISAFLSRKVALFNKFFTWLFEHTRKRHGKKFERYEEFFLVLFVAIPLPATGGWSGALAAFVFGIPPKKAIPLISAGILIAGIIVISVTKGITFVM